MYMRVCYKTYKVTPYNNFMELNFVFSPVTIEYRAFFLSPTILFFLLFLTLDNRYLY